MRGPSEASPPPRPRVAFLKQVSTFGAVSVATTVLDFAIFNVLVSAQITGAIAANTISYSAGIGASYLLNKRFTFAGGGLEKRSHEITLFVLFNIGGLALNNLAVAAVSGLRSTLLLNFMNVLGGAMAGLVKFVAFNHWVYPQQLEAEAAREPG